VERTITGYRQDDQGDWVATLSCGHDQHVRHRPPFQLRAWVIEESGRTGRLGTPLDCPLCDRAELPDGLQLIHSSPVWNEQTVPAGLLKPHRLAIGTWGLIGVGQGRLRVAISVEPAMNIATGAGFSQAVPPDVDHVVTLIGPVRFTLDQLAVGTRPSTVSGSGTRSDPVPSPGSDERGDPACWSGLLCADCGTVLDGSPHRGDCPQTIVGHDRAVRDRYPSPSDTVAGLTKAAFDRSRDPTPNGGAVWWRGRQ
jgi:tellurite methyltransferase